MDKTYRCEEFSITDFIKPIMPLDIDQKTDMEGVLSSSRNRSYEEPIINNLIKIIVKSEYPEIDPNLFSIPSEEHKNGFKYQLPRFLPFQVAHKTNIFEIYIRAGRTRPFSTKKFLHVHIGMYDNAEEISDIPDVLLQNTIKALDLYEKCQLERQNDSYVYKSKKPVDKDFCKNILDKDGHADLLFRLETVLPQSTNKTISASEKYFGENIFIIADRKESNDKLIRAPKYPLVVGTLYDAVFLIDNPSMQEYQELKL